MKDTISLSTEDEVPEVVIAMVRRCGRGRRTKACYLSGRLNGAIRRLAAKEKRSESNLVRELLRHALRERGLLPTNAWGDADHLNVSGHAAP